MKDGIIAETGNSRLIRANLPATYEEMRAMAAAGTLPADILFNAAGWSQLPDFLNKFSLLKDSTAEALGLTAESVPDDALKASGLRLGALDAAVFDHAATYIWNKYSMATALGGDLGETKLSGGNYAGRETTFYYANSVVVNDQAEAELVNPVSINLSYNTAANATVFAGKYITAVAESGVAAGLIDGVHYVPSNAKFTADYDSTQGWGIAVSALQKVSVEKTLVGTVGGSGPDDYPHAGMQGAYYYEYKTAKKTVPQVEIVKHTGTGATSGVSFTFGFRPQMWMAIGYKRVDGYYFSNADALQTGFPWLADGSYVIFSSGQQYCRMEYSGNTVTFVSNAAYSQFNESGYEYWIMAIG